MKAIAAAGDGFETQLAVTKNGNSILKDEGIVNAATAIAADAVVALNFLDANTAGTVLTSMQAIFSRLSLQHSRCHRRSFLTVSASTSISSKGKG